MNKTEFRKRVEEIRKLCLEKIDAGAKPFADCSAAAAAERRAAAELDQEQFIRTYLPHYAEDESAPFHREIDALGAHEDQISVLLAPRGHAKTTRSITIGFLADILFKRRRHLLIVSDTEEQASLMLLPVAVELERNERIRNDFGNLAGEVWRTGEIITRTGIRVLAIGFRQGIRGVKYLWQRPDKAVIDDLENAESARNPAQCKKRLDWVKSDLLFAMIPKGWVILWEGTKLSSFCAIAQAIGEKDENGTPCHNVKVFPAILPPQAGGQPLWPTRFSLEVLNRMRRSSGTLKFNMEMMHLVANAQAIFQRPWMDATSFKYADIVPGKLDELIVVRAGDPTQEIDKAGIMTLGFDPKLHRAYLLQCCNRRLSPLAFMAKLAEYDEAIPAVITIIEENLFKNLLVPVMREKYKRVLIHPTTNTVNKELRIESLQGAFENYFFFFDDAIGDTLDFKQDAEYYGSPGVHDDGLDALEMAYRWIRRRYSGSSTDYKSVARRQAPGILEGF